MCEMKPNILILTEKRSWGGGGGLCQMKPQIPILTEEGGGGGAGTGQRAGRSEAVASVAECCLDSPHTWQTGRQVAPDSCSCCCCSCLLLFCFVCCCFVFSF